MAASSFSLGLFARRVIARQSSALFLAACTLIALLMLACGQSSVSRGELVDDVPTDPSAEQSPDTTTVDQSTDPNDEQDLEALDTNELDLLDDELLCSPPLVACQTRCVDLATDGLHCGRCSNACTSEQVCIAGSCQSRCTVSACTGLSYCDPFSEQCRPGCERDEQCSSAQRCDTAKHDCVDRPSNPANKFGIGLVGPGHPQQWEWSAELAGPGGHLKLIFPGVEKSTSGPSSDWIAAVEGSYARDLVPVIRIGPPWDRRDVRYQSDDEQRNSFQQLGAAYRRVVEGLPLREGWPLWIEVHNEPNLCYEWVCHGDVAGGWIGYQQMAREYAFMLRDVADALHAIGDPRIKVVNGGLAPGGAVRCQCDGSGFDAGITSQEFLQEMKNAVPQLFERLDGFASHSYPARGEGWGFFCPFDEAGPGLRYFEKELAVVGRELPVLMTETGWTTDGDGSREQHAEWTRRAYQELWLNDARIHAVMPFQLQDGGWESFAWVSSGGQPYPVYTAIRALRCSSIAGRCP